jgi:hypothetical protein
MRLGDVVYALMQENSELAPQGRATDEQWEGNQLA